jgi:hypothetical protein
MGMPRLGAIVAVGAVLALAVTPAAPAAAAPAWARDSATAGGYHFQTYRDADVVAGSTDNNLLVTYTAGRPLRDGTIRLVLPGGQWRTPLHPMRDGIQDFPAYDGAVVVRPEPPNLGEPTFDPAAACTGPIRWTVRTVFGSQVVEITHADCAAGQKLAVRMKSVDAPARVGRYHLPILASDPAGPPRLSVAALDVVPTPQITLRVTVPAVVRSQVPFPIEVRAVRPDGGPATDYRGAVAVVAVGRDDCTIAPADEGVAHEFTAADAGMAVIQVTLGVLTLQRLEVYDIANRAVPGVSAPFEVAGPSPPDLSCPASYH